VVAYLGQLDEAGRLGLRHAAAGGSASRQRTFADETEPEWVTVDTAAVRVENCLQFGGPWLALELIRKLGLHTFLERTLPSGNEAVPWSLTALILILSRLCEPSSELHIAEHFYRETALPELLGVPIEKVDDNRLYRGLDHLLPHKAALEAFLKNRLGELLELEYDLLLYDVTSTFFEWVAAANALVQRGYSRDQRSDCKQVCIGLVVSRCAVWTWCCRPRPEPTSANAASRSRPSTKPSFSTASASACRRASKYSNLKCSEDFSGPALAPQ